jgi:hypothetical protein
MTNTSSVTDPRARKAGNIAKWVATIIGCAIIAPIMLLAIGGLAGLITFVTIGSTTLYFRPWFFMKLANWKLQSIKHEARQNPVETLENDYIDQAQKLNERLKRIGDLKGSIGVLESKIATFAKKYGPQDPDVLQMKDDLGKFNQLHANRVALWKEAKAELDRWSGAIERAKAKWEVSLAALDAGEMAGLTEDEILSKLKRDTSLDTIQATYSRALATLDTTLIEASVQQPTNVTHSVPQAALPAPSASATVDLPPPVAIRERQRIS